MFLQFVKRCSLARGEIEADGLKQVCTDEHCQHPKAFILYGSAKFPEGLTVSYSVDCFIFLKKFDEQNPFSVSGKCRHDFELISEF